MKTLSWLAVVLAAAIGIAVFGSGIYWSFFLPSGMVAPGEPAAELPPDQQSPPEAPVEVPVPAPEPQPQPQPAPPPVTRPVWTILALGDSLAAGTGADPGHDYPSLLGEKWQAQHGTTQVINLAQNGAKIEDILQIAQAGTPRAQVILVSAGGNNIIQALLQGARVEQLDELAQGYLAGMEALIQTLTRENPQSAIMVLGLYNPFSQWLPQGFGGWPSSWNQELARLVSAYPRVWLVPVDDLMAVEGSTSFDMVHPGNQGHSLMAQLHLDILNTVPWERP